MSKTAIEEDIKVVSAFPSLSRASADTRYNDNATAASSTGIDTLGFDEALVVLDLGTITGAGTLNVIVMDSSVQAGATGAVAIPGAVFTQKALANCPNVYEGRIKVKNYNRYLHVRAIAATASAKVYGVSVILGKAAERPVSPVNDIGFTV